MNFIKSDDRFSNIEFKIDSCSEHLFDRLTIKVKKYLIKLGTQDHIDPTIDTGIRHIFMYIFMYINSNISNKALSNIYINLIYNTRHSSITKRFS